MPKKFDCEDEPNEFMEAPCLCDCGKWFDLNDGSSSLKHGDNKVICGECAANQERRKELQDEIYDLEIETDNTGKGNKRAIKKLQKELDSLGGKLNDY